MTRRRLFAIALVPTLIGATFAARQWGHPWWMKHRTHAALEEAASNLCACMLGKHGDVREVRRRVAAGAFVESAVDDRAWPARCEPYGKATTAAYRDAWKWGGIAEMDESADWSSAGFLEDMQPYWTRDPDPRVPIPPEGTFAIDTRALARIVPKGKLEPRIVGDRLELGSVAIDHDDHVAPLPEPPSQRKHPAHPDWRPIDAEAGAKQVWFDGSYLVDDAGRRLTSQWFLRVEWARALADGRVIAAVIEGTLEGAEMVYEIAPNGSVKKTAVSVETSRSTQYLDGWLLFKRVKENKATVEAIDFRLGAAAKPVVLGTIDRPMRDVERSYGPCRAKTLFVDMDPSLVARTQQGWTYLPFEPYANRVLACDFDFAIVTEWPPLEIRKCSPVGCERVPFPSLSTMDGDRFGADDERLYRLFRRNGVLGMDIYELPTQSLIHRIALDDAPVGPPTLRVLDDKAIVLLEQMDGWTAFSVRHDGFVRGVQ